MFMYIRQRIILKQKKSRSKISSSNTQIYKNKFGKYIRFLNKQIYNKKWQICKNKIANV